MCIRDRYIWAQLTCWVNPSHRPQGNAMVGMSKALHRDDQSVHISITYILRESESPSTGHGWNEQGFHIMIISVYIWAQLTSWVNPSHRPQGMVEMSNVFTLWSSVCIYEHNLQAELTRVTIHRVWLEWARFSHYDYQCVHISTNYDLKIEPTYELSEFESPSTGHGWNEQGFHIMIITVYTSTTYNLSESESPSTGHG